MFLYRYLAKSYLVKRTDNLQKIMFFFDTSILYKIITEVPNKYGAFKWFGHDDLGKSSFVSDSSQFSILTTYLKKMTLTSKVVESDFENNNLALNCSGLVSGSSQFSILPQLLQKNHPHFKIGQK